MQLIEWPMRIKWKTRADDSYFRRQQARRTTGAAAAAAAARWSAARPRSRPSCPAHHLFKIRKACLLVCLFSQDATNASLVPTPPAFIVPCMFRDVHSLQRCWLMAPKDGLWGPGWRRRRERSSSLRAASHSTNDWHCVNPEGPRVVNQTSTRCVSVLQPRKEKFSFSIYH